MTATARNSLRLARADRVGTAAALLRHQELHMDKPIMIRTHRRTHVAAARGGHLVNMVPA